MGGLFQKENSIRKKAEIQQIVWHLDVGQLFPKSVVPYAGPIFKIPIFKIFLDIFNL